MLAINNLWFIGDNFVNETYHVVKEIQEASKPKGKGWYVFKEFNVDYFTSKPTSHIRSMPAQLVNVFIKALNEHNRILQMVLFVPDWDLAKYVNFYEVGVKHIFERLIGWMLTQISRAIQAKKDSLAHKKAGAVTPSEPKIIWVKMIERVGGEFERALTVRYRFNTVLEDQLAGRKNHFIIDIGKVIADSSYYTVRNSLNGNGAALFWSQLDRNIEIFDYDREEFIPKHQVSLNPNTYHKAQKKKKQKNRNQTRPHSRSHSYEWQDQHIKQHY